MKRVFDDKTYLKLGCPDLGDKMYFKQGDKKIWGTIVSVEYCGFKGASKGRTRLGLHPFKNYNTKKILVMNNKNKLTPAQRIKCLEEASQRLMNDQNSFICTTLQVILRERHDIIINYDSLDDVFIYIPELLHYRPKYLNRDKKLNQLVNPGGSWFSYYEEGKVERLRIIELTIKRIQSRSKKR